MGPNNLDQSIPSMDIIFLVAKICHTTSFADFSSNNYGQGIQYLELGNGLKQAIQLFTHYTTCLLRMARTASLQAITFLMIDAMSANLIKIVWLWKPMKLQILKTKIQHL